jgi:NitT/TauT family transport system substrate-binding protein
MKGSFSSSPAPFICACPFHIFDGWQIPKNGANISVRHCFKRAVTRMDVDRRAVMAGVTGFMLATVPSRVGAQLLEKSSIRLGVANKAHLYYLPLTLAERRGHFRDYGLNVAITDFEGGAQSLEALLAGTVDVVTGAYEHTLRMQAQGRDIRALIELGRFPGIVLAIRKDQPYNSPADLKGMKIGVTTPGSSTHFFVLYLMTKAGLSPTDATFVGVGGGPAAVAAMRAGEIDAISNLDPVITRLNEDGIIRIVTDCRFPRVNYQLFGGTNPAAVLYAKQDFIAANPNTIQALVSAFYKTLKWIATAATDEIVKTVPDDYFLGDREIYVKALKANLLVYSKTGLITRQGMNSALNMLATFDPELKGAKIDLQKTFEDRFVKKAAVLLEDPNNTDLENDDRRPDVDLETIRD